MENNPFHSLTHELTHFSPLSLPSQLLSPPKTPVALSHEKQFSSLSQPLPPAIPRLSRGLTKRLSLLTFLLSLHSKKKRTGQADKNPALSSHMHRCLWWVLYACRFHLHARILCMRERGGVRISHGCRRERQWWSRAWELSADSPANIQKKRIKRWLPWRSCSFSTLGTYPYAPEAILNGHDTGYHGARRTKNHTPSFLATAKNCIHTCCCPVLSSYTTAFININQQCHTKYYEPTQISDAWLMVLNPSDGRTEISDAWLVVLLDCCWFPHHQVLLPTDSEQRKMNIPFKKKPNHLCMIYHIKLTTECPPYFYLKILNN